MSRHAPKYNVDRALLKQEDLESVVEGDHLKEPAPTEREDCVIEMLPERVNYDPNAFTLANLLSVHLNERQDMQAANSNGLHARAGSEDPHRALQRLNRAVVAQCNLVFVALVGKRSQEAARNVPAVLVAHLKVLGDGAQRNLDESIDLHLNLREILQG